jgi:hypothetical protein
MSRDTTKDTPFLARWSQRKAQHAQGLPVAADLHATESPASERDAASAQSSATVASAPQAATPGKPPAPTLDDATALTPQSDFRRFVAGDVDPTVKNAALKKLFADPHFNVMDGLDTYIDDYHNAANLPAAALRQMVQARALGMLDDELAEQPLPEGGAADAANDVAPVEAAEAEPQATAESSTPPEPPHRDP